MATFTYDREYQPWYPNHAPFKTVFSYGMWHVVSKGGAIFYTDKSEVKAKQVCELWNDRAALHAMLKN